MIGQYFLLEDVTIMLVWTLCDLNTDGSLNDCPRLGVSALSHRYAITDGRKRSGCGGGKIIEYSMRFPKIAVFGQLSQVIDGILYYTIHLFNMDIYIIDKMGNLGFGFEDAAVFKKCTELNKRPDFINFARLQIVRAGKPLRESFFKCFKKYTFDHHAGIISYMVDPYAETLLRLKKNIRKEQRRQVGALKKVVDLLLHQLEQDDCLFCAKKIKFQKGSAILNCCGVRMFHDECLDRFGNRCVICKKPAGEKLIRTN